MDKIEIRKILKPIIWDYDIDPYDLYCVAIGQKQSAGGFTQEKVWMRMLERLSWYDLIRLFGVDDLKKQLTEDSISRIRNEMLRGKYEFAREVLQGNTVPLSGWSPEYREKIKHTLLSNRWYRTEQGIS